MRYKYHHSAFNLLFSKFLIFLLVFAWIFSGWPIIGDNPRTPSKIQEAKATTVVSKTVAPSGGDFTSLATAVNWFKTTYPNFVTSDIVGEIKITGNWTSADTNPVTTTGLTTDPTHYLFIYTDANNRASAKWDTGKYRLEVGTYHAINVATDCLRVDGLQIGRQEGSRYNYEVILFDSTYTSASDFRFSNLIVKGPGSSGDTGRTDGFSVWKDNVNLKIWNTVVYNTGAGTHYGAIYWQSYGSSSLIIYNSVIIGLEYGINFSGGSTEAIVKNTYAYGTTAAYNYHIILTSSASNDTTGSSGLQNIPYSTSTFVNVTPGSEDFHLAGTSSPLYHAGTDTSGEDAPLNFTTDIDGDIYATNRSVGVDEITGITSPTATTNAATNVKSYSATLNGSLNMGSESSVNVFFRWRKVGDTNFTSTTSQPATTSGSFSANLTGLTASTTYEYKAVVSWSGGEQEGSLVQFSTPADTTAPTPGNSGTINTSNIGASSLVLSWAKATDNQSDQSRLLYRVYYATSSNINTVSNIEANGTPLNDYTQDINSFGVSGLSPNTPYYFNLIVKDEGGNKAAYTMTSATTTQTFQYTTSALKVLPSAAVGVSVSASATAWGNSSWVQVIASASTDIVIVGVVAVSGSRNEEFEIDVGKGIAGSETVVATISGDRESSAGATNWLRFPIPIDNISASTRVAVRVRRSGTQSNTYTIKLVYYEKPISGSVSTTSNPCLVMPSAAAGTSVTLNSTAWQYSNWYQVIASTSDAIVVGGITVNPAAAAEYEVDIGVGSSTAETVVTTIRGQSATVGSPQTIIINPLLDNIPSGSRVVVRIRANTTTTTAWRIKIIYYNKTNLGVGSSILTTKPLKWSPSGTAGASVSPPTTAWANPANWTQLIASVTTTIGIAAVEVYPASAFDFELEFGIGSAGSEVPIGLVRGRVLSTTATNIYTLNISPMISVPSGQRLAVRIRTGGTTGTAWLVSVGYYENPDSTNILKAPHLSLPYSANSASVSCAASAWGNSSFVQLTAGLSDTIYINRIIVRPSAAAQFEIDIAIGDSNTVVTTVAGQAVTVAGMSSIIELPVPLKISANTRIAMRIRTSLTSAATWYLALEYVPDQQIKQSAYRFFNNLDSTDVGSALAAQDTPATLSLSGAAFRLRMLLHMTTNELTITSGQSFKLQFATQGGDNLCDATSSGENYIDVTTSTVIAFNDNSTPADGAALTTNANDPTHGSDAVVNQTYEESNNFTNSQAVIPVGQDGKWDFSLKDNNTTPTAATYCLRAVKDTGILLESYNVIPQITTSNISQSLTLTITPTTVNLGTLVPQIPTTATTTATVVINGYSNGYHLDIKRDSTTSTLHLSSDPSITFPDYSPSWNPAANSGNGNATTTPGAVFSFRVMSSGTTSNYNSNWWGANDSVGTAKYAGMPASSANIVVCTSTACQNGTTTSIIQYRADAPISQPVGNYTGTVTITVLGNI